MRDVYEAESLFEAQLLLDRLAEARIEARVRNAHLQGALGELPLNLLPIVSVLDERDWVEALAIASDFQEAKEAGNRPALRCCRCGEDSPGNFELCWSCRSPFAL